MNELYSDFCFLSVILFVASLPINWSNGRMYLTGTPPWIARQINGLLLIHQGEDTSTANDMLSRPAHRL
jgi:hypothetical protein